MIFPLRRFRSSTPIPSLAGAHYRYKPLIPLTVIGPLGQESPAVLLDSGADDVVFPVSLATRIGVDLSQAPQRHSQGIGSSQPSSVVYAPAILLLTDYHQTFRWRAVVGFTRTPLRWPLFGIAGGLEFFRTTLDIVQQTIELTPYPSLPSTQAPAP